jgi:hypothetical protein
VNCVIYFCVLRRTAEGNIIERNNTVLYIGIGRSHITGVSLMETGYNTVNERVNKGARTLERVGRNGQTQRTERKYF